MQMTCGRRRRKKQLKMLPTDVLAEIMGYLEQKDLLNMRLVSRHFSSLAHMQQLQLKWIVSSQAAAASLSFFAFRHCMGTSEAAPKLTISVSRKDGGEEDQGLYCWSSLTLALNCSRLTAIQCESWELTLLQAQFLLQAAPSQLTSLGLRAPQLILQDQNWQRLSMLTHLIQKLCAYTSNTPCGPGQGIAKLPLKTYSFGSYCENGFQVFANGFKLPPVEVLKLYGDPFPSNAVTLPILQELHICCPSSQLLSMYACCDLQIVHLCAEGCPDETRSLLILLAQFAEQIACQHLVLEGLCCEADEDHGLDLFGAVCACPSFQTCHFSCVSVCMLVLVLTTLSPCPCTHPLQTTQLC